MKKENIPFIFKYLMRWVPGLRTGLEEGGDTPKQKDLIVGDPIYSLYFNTAEDIDTSKLVFYDPADFGIETHEGSSIFIDNCEFSPLLQINLEAGGSGIQPISMGMIKYPAGSQFDDITLSKDNYLLLAFMSNDSETVWNESSCEPLYGIGEIAEMVGGQEGWFSETPGSGSEPGSPMADELTVMLAYSAYEFTTEEESGESLVGVVVGNVWNQNTWRSFMDPMPFVRTEPSYDVCYSVLYYNDKVTPDFTKLDWNSSEVITDDDVKYLILYCEDEHPSNHSLMAAQFASGTANECYMLYNRAGYGSHGLLYADQKTINYLIDNYGDISMSYEVSDFDDAVPGWFPVKNTEGVTYCTHSEDMKAIGYRNSIEYYSQYDIIKNWIDIYPFE